MNIIPTSCAANYTMPIRTTFKTETYGSFHTPSMRGACVLELMGSTTSMYLFQTDPLDEDSLSGLGPKGLGDPADESLRQYEVEISIPNMMNKKIISDKCKIYAEEHEECLDDSLIGFISCSEFSKKFNSCYEAWNNEQFKEDCTTEYVRIRSKYRREGRKRLLNVLKGTDVLPAEGL